MMEFNVKAGCDEWQSEWGFDTYDEARDFIENNPDDFTLGAYTADYIWIEDDDMNILEEFM